jgi:hypothetical protein
MATGLIRRRRLSSEAEAAQATNRLALTSKIESGRCGVRNTSHDPSMWSALGWKMYVTNNEYERHNMSIRYFYN